jgi:hypothetical protein
MISITAIFLILLFFGWSQLGDEGLVLQQPYQPYFERKGTNEENQEEEIKTLVE